MRRRTLKEMNIIIFIYNRKKLRHMFFLFIIWELLLIERVSFHFSFVCILFYTNSKRKTAHSVSFFVFFISSSFFYHSLTCSLVQWRILWSEKKEKKKFFLKTKWKWKLVIENKRDWSIKERNPFLFSYPCALKKSLKGKYVFLKPRKDF